MYAAWRKLYCSGSLAEAAIEAARHSVGSPRAPSGHAASCWAGGEVLS